MTERTPINFSLKTDVLSAADVCISLVGIQIDSGAAFFAVDKVAYDVGSLFLTLHSSLENAVFRVRECFEKVVISVKNGFRKFAVATRSMWRGRMEQTAFRALAKRSSYFVMRT